MGRRGKRYQTEGKLNYLKVFAVIIAMAVVVMFVYILKDVLAQQKQFNQGYEYFSLYTTNKWGVINQNGEEVIAPSYREMIIIPNKSKDVFLCMYNINENNETYQTKAINSKNEQIFMKYQQIEALENIDKNGNVWYEENVLKVRNNNKYGLIDLNGREILPCEYEDITVLKGIANSFIIKRNNKLGLTNENGSIIIEPSYNEIKNLGETYKEGYITINEEGKYGVVSSTKKQILENKYDEIMQVYLSDSYLVKESDKTKLINSSGEAVLESGFDEIKSKTRNGFIIVKDNLYGEIDIKGQETIKTQYQDLKEAKSGIYIAKLNDKYGLIDKDGETKLLFDYEGIIYNEEAKVFIAEDKEYNTSIIDSDYNVKLLGILSEINTQEEYIKMRVQDEYKYYNFKFEEKSNTEILKDNKIFLIKEDNKYGFVNKKGKKIVDCIYDDATEQNEYGFAAVKKNGLWGVVNAEGKEVVAPKYDLSNNLIIDFIGKWHLGQDLNMNYYCDK